jgi:hypothetical protein
VASAVQNGRGTMEKRFDLRPLAHPVWWAALAVMLVNDNLLKGTGRAPGWLTGKLSDFAFLIVAPVLLGALLPRAWARRRALACAAVAAVFVAADLSTAASDAVVAVAALAGLRWRLWPDVTDLAALAVLPVAWSLLGPRAAAARPAARAPVIQPFGVIVGMFACLATSALHLPQFPFLVNRSAGPADVRITWVLRQVRCDEDLLRLAGDLTAGDLGPSDRMTLARGEVAALDDPPPAGESSARFCTNENRTLTPNRANACQAMLVELEGGPTVLARSPHHWEDETNGAFLCPTGERSRCRSPMNPDDDPGEGALSIIGAAGAARFLAHAKIDIVDVSRAAIEARGTPAGSCRDLEQRQESLATAPAACATDGDCASVLTGRLDGCRVLTNDAGAAAFSDLEKQRAMRCLDLNTRHELCPDFVQLPVCAAGLCAEPCPGQRCPRACGWGESSLLECKQAGALCQTDVGHWCRCENGLWSCGDPGRFTSCRARCVGLTSPPPDAGPFSRD